VRILKTGGVRILKTGGVRILKTGGVRILKTGGVLLVATFVLGACVSPSAVQSVADKTFELPEGDVEGRGIRALGAVTIISEVAADRVTREQPMTAGETLARLNRLDGVIAALGDGDSAWVETEFYEVRLALYAIIVDGVKDRDDIVPNLTALLHSIKRAGKTKAMVNDIQAMFDRYMTGDLSAAQVRGTLVQRFEFNKSRIQAIKELVEMGLL